MTEQEKKPDLLSLTPDELADLMEQIGEARYRAKQLFQGLHRGLAP